MMDFLDPKRSRATVIKLWTGYALLTIAIVLAAVVLLYQAGGYSVSREGRVIQNGLLFVSTAPSGARVFLNGERQSNNSNTQITLPAGTYTMRLVREGYRDWQRAVAIEGGDVVRADYPLLVPRDLEQATVNDYQAEPPLVLQSPDRRWLLVQLAGQPASFDVYDLRDPEQVGQRRTTISLPASVVSLAQADTGDGRLNFELAEWSRDNDHVLLRYNAGGQSEYVMLSRTEPEQSFNLSRRLQLTAGDEVTLRDKKFDRYFVHSPARQVLQTAERDATSLTPLLSGVIDYKSYGENVVLYATGDGAGEGTVSVKLYQNERSYTLRQLPASDKGYLLDVSTFDDQWYAVAGTVGQPSVYVYANPAQRLRADVTQPLAPANILKLNGADYVEFSANSRFVLAQSGRDAAVYDVDDDRSYTYQIPRAIDAPQRHVTWMDGYRLSFVSEGRAVMMDYDGTNTQVLTPATAATRAMYDTSYQTAYAVAPVAGANGTAGGWRLAATPLRTAQDR